MGKVRNLIKHCLSRFAIGCVSCFITACEIPNWGTNCSKTCECGAGTERCDPSRGCVCMSGWEGDLCDKDINECTLNPGLCTSVELCQNTEGGYYCNCPTGYEKINNKCSSKSYGSLVI